MKLTSATACICLILFNLSTPVTAQLISRDDLPDMTIKELFDAGGGETDWWAMRAMPWPIDDLFGE